MGTWTSLNLDSPCIYSDPTCCVEFPTELELEERDELILLDSPAPPSPSAPAPTPAKFVEPLPPPSPTPLQSKNPSALLVIGQCLPSLLRDNLLGWMCSIHKALGEQNTSAFTLASLLNT